jgi:hypothetical protein
MLKACGLAVLLFASTAVAQDAVQDGVKTTADASAQERPAEMSGPRISAAEMDWGAARAALAGLDQLPAHDDTASAPAPDVVTRLNAATETIFAKIATSPVPVLLPFDTAAYLHDLAQGQAGDTGKYLAGFHAATFFYPGPSGYDAAFSFQARDIPGLDLTFVKRIDVQISGFAFVYELDGPAVADGSPVRELESEFPGIRRILLESRLRYTFVRFGVPYALSIGCFDGAKRERRLSCREADRVAVRFLKALNIAGGTPQGQETKSADAKAAPQTIERPDKISPDFTYYPPGDIISGSGIRGQSGQADATVYSKIRFPIAHAPAYTNSQSFMNWGNCDFTGRVALGGHGKDATYRCRVNAMPLVHDETKNYAYPWRDNFCEHRYYYVTQCPAGLGHQGQDIRPSSCKLRNEGADRCEPYQDDVVAVRDGVTLRVRGDEALYLVVNKPGEHIRFRYLHMNPHMLDAAGLVSGRALSEGEVLGPVGDYGIREGGTTYHLHFDAQVPTRHGWVFVNPYMTLVAAYERLIGERGQVVNDAMLARAAPSAAAPSPDGHLASAPPNATDATPGPNSSAMSPDAVVKPKATAEQSSEAAQGSETASERRQNERESVRAEHCKTRFVRGHRRRVCRVDIAEGRERGRHAHGVRSVDRRVSHQGGRARHHGRHLHARHGRAAFRHHRA